MVSGKTSFRIKLLRNLDTLCTESRLREGLSENYGNALGEPSLIILDDLLNEVDSKDVCDLFTKGGHHRNISVLLLTENLFHQGTNCRDILLNAKYLVLLKNVRDKNHFLYLERQAYPEDSHSLYNVYRDATRQSHGI